MILMVHFGYEKNVGLIIYNVLVPPKDIGYMVAQPFESGPSFRQTVLWLFNNKYAVLCKDHQADQY